MITVRSVLAVLVRPSLWSTAVRVVLRLAAPGWWRRRPHLPLPPPDYLNFRLVTAYGGDGTAYGGDGTAYGGDGTAYGGDGTADGGDGTADGGDGTADGGDGTGEPDPSDLVTYLEWCRSWPAVTRRA